MRIAHLQVFGSGGSSGGGVGGGLGFVNILNPTAAGWLTAGSKSSATFISEIQTLRKI